MYLPCGLLFHDFFTSERCSNINGKRIKSNSGEKGKYFIDVRTVGEYRGNQSKALKISLK